MGIEYKLYLICALVLIQGFFCYYYYRELCDKMGDHFTRIASSQEKIKYYGIRIKGTSKWIYASGGMTFWTTSKDVAIQQLKVSMNDELEVSEFPNSERVVIDNNTK